MKKELLRKLRDYGSAAAGLIAISSQAESQIIYTDVNPDYNDYGYGYFDLDLNNDGVADFRIQKDASLSWCEVGTSSAGSSWCYDYGQIRIKALDDGEVQVASIPGLGWLIHVNALEFNEPVDEAASWKSNLLVANPHWDYSEILKNVFVGLRLNIDSNHYYGWIRLDIRLDGEKFCVHDYAYDTVANESILAGEGYACDNSGVSLVSTQSCLLNGQIRLLPMPHDASQYLWYKDGVKQSFTTDSISVSQDGMYQVITVDFAGCRDTSNTIKVSRGITIVPAVINQAGATLYSSVAATYQWFRGDNPIDAETNNNHSPPSTGVYGVNVTDEHGCASFAKKSFEDCASYETTIEELSPYAECEGYAYALVSNTPAISYQWQINELNDYSSPYSPNVHFPKWSGDYRLITLSASGCRDTSNVIHADLHPLPKPVITQSGDTLWSTPAQFYQWYSYNELISGATDQYYVPVLNGYYIVHTTDSIHCEQVSSSLGFANCGHLNSAFGLSGSLCDDYGLKALVSNLQSYQWLKDGLPVQGATSSYYSVPDNASGNYQLVASISNTCFDTSATYFVPASFPVVTISGDTVKTNFDNNISWSTYDTAFNSLILISPPNGNYTVTHTDSSGCSFSTAFSFFNCHNNHIEQSGEFNCGTTQYSYLYLGFAPPVDTLNYSWRKNGEQINNAASSFYSPTDTGDYDVIVTTSGGCIDTSNTIHITGGSSFVHAEIMLSNDTLIASGGTNYQWLLNGYTLEGETSAVLVPEISGDYKVTVSDNEGCSATSAFIPYYLCIQKPIIHGLTVDTVCQTASVTLSTDVISYFKLQWQKFGQDISGATNSSYHVLQSGEYKVIATLPNCCSDTSDVKNIYFQSNPSSFNISQSGDTLIANTSFNVYWFDSGNHEVGFGKKLLPTANGNYYAKQVDSLGCTSQSSSFSFYSCPLVNYFIAAYFPFASCGSSYGLHLNSTANTYQWQKDEVSISGATASSYYAAIEADYRCVVMKNGCSDTTAEVHIHLEPAPTATITVVNDTLVAPPGFTYEWTDDYDELISTSQKFYPSYISTFYLHVMDSIGCSAYSSYDYAPCGRVEAEIESNSCGSPDANLYAEAYDALSPSYQWLYNGSFNGNTSSHQTTSQDGDYQVVIHTSNGCTDTSEIFHLIIHPYPVSTITYTNDTLHATGSGSFQWTWSSFGYTNIMVKGGDYDFLIPDKSGKYWVNITDSFCTASSVKYSLLLCSDFDSTINSPFYDSTLVCGLSYNQLQSPNYYSSSSGITYQWNKDGIPVSGATLSYYAPTSTGNYNVINNDGNGHSCSVSEKYFLFKPPAQNPVLLQQSDSIFTTTSAAGYQWYGDASIPGATSSSYHPVMSDNYSLRATDTNGCVGNSWINYYRCLESEIINDCDVSACALSGNKIYAPPYLGYNYQWLLNGSSISGATSNSFIPVSSGEYRVVISANGTCTDTSKAVDIGLITAPVISLGNDTLHSTVAVSYQWQLDNTAITGATDQLYTPLQNGIYTIGVIDSDGCSGLSNSILVCSFIHDSVFAIQPTEFCEGDQCSFQSLNSNATSFQWYSNGAVLPGATSTNYTAVDGANYFLVGKDSYGCADTSNSITIIVYPLPPVPSIIQSGDTLLTAGGYASYQWYFNAVMIPGATNFFFVINLSGIYSVEVTDSNDCKNLSAPLNVIATLIHEGMPFFISFYPNPNNGEFILEISDLSSPAFQLNILSNVGEVLRHEQHSVNSGDWKETVALDGWPPGFYFLELIDESRNWIFPLVVIH